MLSLRLLHHHTRHTQCFTLISHGHVWYFTKEWRVHIFSALTHYSAHTPLMWISQLKEGKLCSCYFSYSFGRQQHVLIMATHNSRKNFIFSCNFTSPSIHRLFTSWRRIFCIVSSQFESAYLISFDISVTLIFQDTLQRVKLVCNRNSLQILSLWGAGRGLSPSFTASFIYCKMCSVSYLSHWTSNACCPSCFHISIQCYIRCQS